MFNQSLFSIRPLLTTIFLLVSLLLSAVPVSAWEAQVHKVHDGDTVEIIRKGREMDVRFYGIDCPEKDQPYGVKAKRFVERMCNKAKSAAGGTVDIVPSGQDRYGRVIGLVYVDGEILNELLVTRGLAWVYDRYCQKSICDKWNRLKRQARGSGVGLLADSDPIAPWDWRHGGRSSGKHTSSQRYSSRNTVDDKD